MTNNTTKNDIPRILVLESYSGGARAVRNAGGTVRTASPTDAKAVAQAFDSVALPVHGVLLTGGGDVNPRLYRRRPHRKVYGVSEVRDAVEIAAIDLACKRGLPVLGICRGMQIQNVRFGGVMRQHIGGHSGVTHPVIPTAGSTFAAAVGNRASVSVTSLHHQECLKTGRGWRVTGRAPDGTVEAIESVDGRCLGVQFHPEMDQDDEYARDIFRWLVNAAADRAGLPHPVPSYSPPRYTFANGPTGWADKGRPAPMNEPIARCQFDGVVFYRRRDYEDHMAELHDVWIYDDPDYLEAEGPTPVWTGSTWDDPDGYSWDTMGDSHRMTEQEWCDALAAAEDATL